MRVSGIAVKQRETEAKALRLFLTSSLIGSLVLHFGLLASGVLSMNVQTPETEDEPIELTFIDPPIPEETKVPPKPEPPKPEPPKPEPPKPEPQQLEKIEPPIPEPETITNSLSDPGGSSASSAIPQTSEFKPQIPEKPIVPETPPRKIPQIPKPKVEQTEPLKPIQPPPQVTKVPPKPIQPPPQVTKVPPKSIQSPPQIAKIPPKPVPQIQPTQEANEDLQRLLTQEKNSRTKPELSVPQTPIQEQQPTQKTNDDLRRLLAQQQSESRTPREFSVENTPTQSSPSDTSNSSPKIATDGDTSSRRRRRDFGGNNGVATAPTTPNPGIGSGTGTGDSIGDGDGRAACRRCRTSYPSWAKRKGIEGKIIVALNTDAQGNVTNVELVSSSSGNDRFDKEHLKLARKWKLKPSSSGRQGVRIITNYVLK